MTLQDRVLSLWRTDLPVPRGEVARRVATCERNECGWFAHQTCTERGSHCQYEKRWLERLFTGRCPFWEDR